jgi:hypothetical protein
MVVAVFAGQENLCEKVVTRIVKKVKDNTNTCTFCFETINQLEVPNFSSFFEDLSYIGRHYLLSASSDPIVRRQYTVCNTFIPDFFIHIFKLCQAVIEGEAFEFDYSLINSSHSKRFYLTLKNYKQPTGLSAKIHA